MNLSAGRVITALIIFLPILAFISCSGEKDEFAGSTEISILFSSDLRGNIRSCGCAVNDMGGLGRMASYVEGVRKESKNTVFITSGDNFSANLSFSRNKADLAMASYELMGLDVYTPGEYEFIFGLDYLKDIGDAYSFDIILANLMDPETGEPIFKPQYVVKQMDSGLKIAVTGIIDDGIVFPGYVDLSGFRVEPEAEVLAEIVPRMRKEADLMFLVCHMEMDDAEELLRQVDDFDIALLGHNKPKLDRAITVGETVLLGAGGQGMYMGRLNYLINRKGLVEYSKARLVPLKGDIGIHSGVRRLFESYGVELTDKEAEKKKMEIR